MLNIKFLIFDYYDTNIVFIGVSDVISTLKRSWRSFLQKKISPNKSCIKLHEIWLPYLQCFHHTP